MSAVANFVRSHLFWIVAFHTVGFLAAVTFLPPEIYFPVLHALRLCVAAVVIATFSPGISNLLAQRELDQGSQLILGILLVWASEFCIGLWSFVWRVSDQSWMLNSPALAALLYMKVLGGTMHVTSPRDVGGLVPRRSWILLIAGTAIAALLAGIVIGAQLPRFLVPG
ncbi:hypothetical protein J2X65_003470 [Ancylobacter sp. 3268]|uniref:hypothetical protein n=1 Tax=Ancylobacter sp. 3268 TaxID=2817752 RepID=UPI0028584A6D|nr:hypothetical protein [Ancylobacter sp. 3268]MDR6954102.1 hypothetical protein [Ancylobacter sp. 3268]